MDEIKKSACPRKCMKCNGHPDEEVLVVNNVKTWVISDGESEDDYEKPRQQPSKEKTKCKKKWYPRFNESHIEVDASDLYYSAAAPKANELKTTNRVDEQQGASLSIGKKNMKPDKITPKPPSSECFSHPFNHWMSEEMKREVYEFIT